VITTEGLFTSPDAFGITTATPVQLAACRIVDGRPLGELAEHPDVQAALGGPEAVAKLPSEAPLEFIMLAAIRGAKSILASAKAIQASQTVDCSKLGPGEVPRIPLTALKLDGAGVIHGLIAETMKQSTGLRGLLTDEPTVDRIPVKQATTGKLFEICPTASNRAGGSHVSRWHGTAIWDEASRQLAAAEGFVRNLDEDRAASLGRLLPGAMHLLIGSPSAPSGLIYDLTQERFGKPSSDCVVLRATGPMLNPYWWTPERCARLQRVSPNAYTTDVLAEFADPESGLLSPFALHRCTREGQLEIPYERGRHRYFASIDPSEGTAGGNAWTLAIGKAEPTTYQNDDDEEVRGVKCVVVLAVEFRGLGPDQALKECAQICHRYEIKRATTDQYAGSANADLAQRHGLYLDIIPTTGPNKLEDFTRLATWVVTERVEIPPHKQLKADLLSVRKRAVQNGYQIILPRTADGRHCDFAPVVAALVKQVDDHGVPMDHDLLAAMHADGDHYSTFANMPGRGF
jgi:hypothetical protein